MPAQGKHCDFFRWPFQSPLSFGLYSFKVEVDILEEGIESTGERLDAPTASEASNASKRSFVNVPIFFYETRLLTNGPNDGLRNAHRGPILTDHLFENQYSVPKYSSASCQNG